jgi:ssDNA-binding Zn-finger/Zn-ribbon topoisomerase 1
MGPDRFTCTKCQLRIWRNFMGYELTPTDLQEMLHGDKVTSTEKTLTRQKDGQEITIRGRLMLNEEYKVRIAPKLKSKTATDQACPKCKTGKLQLITGIDDSKWYGCSGYPQCRFTKTYLPHTFTPAMLQADSGGEKPGSKHANRGKDGQGSDSGGGQSQTSTLKIQKMPSAVKPPGGAPKPDKAREVSPGQQAVPEAAAAPALDASAQHPAKPDRYRRIPTFILEMLHLPRSHAVALPETPSIS